MAWGQGCGSIEYELDKDKALGWGSIRIGILYMQAMTMNRGLIYN